MDQIGKYAVLGAAGLLALFVLAFAFLGLLNGRKKAIYRWITFAIYAVIVFVLSNTIIKFIFNFDISTFYDVGNVLPGDLSGGSVNEIITNAITQYIGTGDAATEATEFVMALLISIFKLVFYIVMILLVYIVYWLITQIIWWFIKGKRRDPETGLKKKKHRLVGAGLGALKGLVVYILFLTIVINGPLSLIPDATTPEDSSNNQQNLSTSPVDNLPIDDVMAVLNEYKESPFYKIFGGSNPDSLNDKINDFVWNGKYGETEVNIRNELQTFIGIAFNALDLVDAFGGGVDDINLGHEQYVALSNSIKGLTDSNLLMTLLPLAANVALSMEQVTSNLPEDIDLTFVKDIQWEDDINAWGQLVLDAEPIINGLNLGETIDFSSLSNKGTAIETFFTTLSSITLLTEGLDAAVSYVIKSQGFDEKIENLTETVSSIVWEDDIKQLGKILSAFMDLGYTSFDELGVSMVNTINIDKAIAFVRELFALQLLEKLLPAVMDMVLKDVDPSLKELFNFDDAGGVDFENEFVTLLTIVKESRGTGATPEELFTTDGSINFGILNNLRTETILSSELLSGAVQTLLIQASKGEGLASSLSDVIVIPTNLQNKEDSAWMTYGYRCEEDDSAYNGVGATKDTIISEADYKAAKDASKITVDNWKKVVISGELYNAIDGLKSIITSLDISSFEDLSLDATLINKISEDGVEKITKSTILNATVTKLLLNMMSGAGGVVTIPASAITKTNDVDMLTINDSHNELLSLVRAVKAIGISDFSDISISTDMLTNLLNPNEPTKYKCINAVDAYKVNDEITKVVYDGLEESKQANFEVSEYKVFAYTNGTKQISPEAYALLDNTQKAQYSELYTNLDRVLDSDILSCTFSKVITDMASGVISVPSSVVSEVPVQGSDDKTKLIAKTELSSLIEAVGALDIDFTNMGDLDIAGLLSKLVSEDPDDSSKLVIDGVLDSKIMHATLSEKIDGMAGDILIVPAYAKDSEANITKLELKNLVIAIDNLDIDMDNMGDMDIGGLLSKLVSEDPDDSSKLVIDNVLNSDIMHATLSNKIDGMSGSVLVVPAYAKDSEANITKLELKNLVIAIDTLGIDMNGMDNMDINSMLSTLTSKDGSGNYNIDTVTNSDIMHATLSNKIDGMAGSILIIPSTAEDTNNNISKIELKNLFISLKKLDIQMDSLSNLQVGTLMTNLNKVDTDDNAKLVVDVVTDSKIMHATIANKILGMESSLSIPLEVKTSEGDADVITKVELKNLVIAIDKLDINLDDMGSMNYLELINELPNTVNGTGKTKLDFATDSAIIYCVLSKAIVDQGTSTLVITSSSIDNTTYSKSATEKYNVIVKAELTSLVKALGPDGLGAVDNGSIGDVNSLLSNAVSNSSVVSDSEIIRATITAKLPVGTLTIEKDSYDVKEKFGTASSINVATENEMNSLLTALDILGVSDFSSVDIGLGKVFSMLTAKYPDSTSNETEIDYLLKSGILWATINEKLSGFKKGNTDLLAKPIYGSSSIQFVGDAAATDAYDTSLYTSLTIERYSRAEVKAILGAFSAIMGPTTGDDFEISSEMLAGIYGGEDTHRLEVANAITNSVVMTFNIKNLVGDSVSSVAGSYATAIMTSLDTITSYSDWKYYSSYDPADATLATPLNGRTDADWRDGQLYKLLTSLNSFADFVSFNAKATGATADNGKALALAVNNSRVTGVIVDDVIRVQLIALNPGTASTKYADAFGKAYDSADNEIYSKAIIEAAIDKEFE